MRLVLPRARARFQAEIADWWRRLRLPFRRILLPVSMLLILYGLWPYAVLWNLHRAVIQQDQARLASLVDLNAVRAEIRRRLNKDVNSAIEMVSDPFIDWLETGIRRSGAAALEELVTVEWVMEQLNAGAVHGTGFLPALSYGFFVGPSDFRLRIGRLDAQPRIARLNLGGSGWRLTMLYY